MGLVLVTPPSTEPLEVEEALDHLRLELDAEDRDEVTRLAVAARQQVEEYTRRALVTQTWQLTLDAFPDCGPVRLPMPPLVSVTFIKYLDLAGVLQTLAPADYVVDVTSIRGRIVPAYGKTWPDTRCTLNAVQIEFVAGYGDATKVPEGLKSGIKLRLGDLYENRETIVTGTIVAESPVGRVLALYRAPEV